MATILLVGGDAALLEGLSQSLGALGHKCKVISTPHEARERAAHEPPLIVVVDREFAASASSEVLGIPLAAGGARVLYATMSGSAAPLPPVVQRAVMADLHLPLERNRLVALVQHVEERARATGRGQHNTPTERRLH